MINGKRHGGLADIVVDEIKSRRRIELGLDPPRPTTVIPLPGQQPADRRNRELEGGIIIVGRHTFKEFMHGLKRGWSEPPYKVDKEELLSRELEFDGVFDEVDTVGANSAMDQSSADPDPFPKTIQRSPFYFPPQLKAPPKTSPSISDPATVNPQIDIPPSTIPTYPPILLVPFTNLVGFSLIPRMIWDFFNQRHKVREGADAAYRLVTSSPRLIRGPSSYDEHVETLASSDLSFDLQVESLYRSTSLPSDIEKSRKSYYEALRSKLVTARQLARGEREPTKDERNYPPPTEVELRTERMTKELRWKGDLSGLEIISPATPVAWDSRFETALSVYPEAEQDDAQQTQTTRLS
jgi:mitochondrial import inner membrane translocase subunit TIM54